MGLFKADFYRFFGFGFAAGAVLVLATIGISGVGNLVHEVVPSAVAAPSQ
jgi:mannose/fructose/N-acetylgalactosamine-specific phosphotransferase system component IIC